MAKTKKNVLIQGLSGKVGDMVFRQMPDGSTRVSTKPNFDGRVFSQEQKGSQNRFRLAVAYAREAKFELFYVELAREKARSAYHLALSDCLTPPVIHSIARNRGLIRVSASDDVLVTKIQVKILDKAGNVLEDGQAWQVDPCNQPERWEYAPKADGTVEATAWDLAGNQTTAAL